MASSHPGLKKIGPFWHYELRVNGQRLHGSTKATDLATAKKVLEIKRREALEGQYRIISRIPTLKEVFDQWLRTHQGIFSQRHLVPTECVFRKWLQPRMGSTRTDQIGSSQVENLRSDATTAGLSPRTINNILKTLQVLLNYGFKSGFIKGQPMKIGLLRVQKKPRPVLPAARINEFLEAVDRTATNPHVQVILRVMIGLGLRESEALGMRWEWFDPQQRTYVVGKSKGREARVLPVPEWLWNAIHGMPKTLSEWVFPAEDGKPHRPQFCKKALQRVCLRLGLGNVTQHRLRATFATLHATVAKTPITEIMGLLGHKAVTTTMIYVESALENKRKAQEIMSMKLGLGIEPARVVSGI
ncbi:tyrosine-type recombinase/integrase [Mesoterricola sediminis]|uniref:Site-specific recombinase XerD n=1 Tax=Mesoterricola sediminis TaxID=2927980 RepID=A0AA48KHI6_9BACT|nr:tyrosine-type recombinase/integrase [Mesoterricola sediminis]BDU78413.1 hypothetical protein METESE_33710 [Mesoterricola sediminis]